MHLPPRVAGLVSASAAAVLALVLLPASSVHADPVLSEAQVRRAVVDLQVKLEKATEAYDTANELLAQSLKTAARLRAQAAAQSKTVARFAAAVGKFAASAYQGGEINMFTALLDSGSPQAFLDELSTIETISRGQRAQLNGLIAAKHTLESQKRRLARELVAQQENQRILTTRKAQITKDLAHYRALAAQITGEASRAGNRAVIGGTYTGPASGSARIALQTAYAQLGKPYVWGAAGPRSFDCSGLTMYAWAAAGVSLPHSSRMQFSSGRHVARANLQAGDLVFFGSPIYHVGMYVGNGEMIHAPTTGDHVRIAPLLADYSGAVRP